MGTDDQSKQQKEEDLEKNYRMTMVLAWRKAQAAGRTTLSFEEWLARQEQLYYQWKQEGRP